MNARRVLTIGVASFALGSAACGAFLGLSGDDEEAPPPASTDDAGAADGSSNSEGGTIADGAAGGDGRAAEDAATVDPRATCAGTQCMPGQACCVAVTNDDVHCLVGEQTCPGHELFCTRTSDCGSGHVCCIEVSGGQSTSTCTPGTSCSSRADVLCATDEAAGKNGCTASQTCSATGKVTSVYNLPTVGRTFGVCE